MLKTATNYLSDPIKDVKTFCDYILTMSTKKIKDIYSSISDFIDKNLLEPVDYDSLLQRELNHMWICSICKCCRSCCYTCNNKH